MVGGRAGAGAKKLLVELLVMAGEEKGAGSTPLLG